MKKILISLFCLLLLVGCAASVPQNVYDQMVNERNELATELKELEEAYGKKEKIEEEVAKLQKESKELDDVINNNKELAEKITNAESVVEEYEKREMELNDSIANLEKEEKELTGKVESLEQEKDNLQEQVDNLGKLILEKDGEPLYISPGSYSVGKNKDIKPGRYQVTGKSNFFIRESSGYSTVNVILGGSYGVESYTFDTKEGDSLETHGGCTLTPIK